MGETRHQANAIGPGYIATEMNRALLDDPKFDTWVKVHAVGTVGQAGGPHRRRGVPRLAGLGLRQRPDHMSTAAYSP
jgi:NAD(P)-dependent dehydrogenase (short-subunit alcohol dehydrogenase family)